VCFLAPPLILGFGEIGQALAAYCKGLGMNVIATKTPGILYRQCRC